MEPRRPLDADEETQAFERIDRLLAGVSKGKVQLRTRTTSAPSSAAMPPIDRIIGAAEELLSARLELERNPVVTAELRESFERMLQTITVLCDDFGFATARVRVDFMREDLRRGCGDLKSDITELMRHLRYDARTWPPERPAKQLNGRAFRSSA